MSEPRREWGTLQVLCGQDHAGKITIGEAQVEALRAIAEELETHNVLLERMCTAFEDSKTQFTRALGDCDDALDELREKNAKQSNADEPETAAQREHLEKARAARRFADESEALLDERMRLKEAAAHEKANLT